MRRLRRLMLAALAAGLLGISLWLVALPTGFAGGGPCQETYTVQRGDTLAKIAAHLGVDRASLAQVNGIQNSDRIYIGQVLCVPIMELLIPYGQATEGNEGAAKAITTESRLDLVIEYTFAPEAEVEANVWTLGKDRKAGKRLSFPLTSGDVISTYATPDEVLAMSVQSEEPAMFWLARSPKAEPFTYTFVMIGDWAPLLDMQMAFTYAITDIIKVPTQAAIAQVTATAAGVPPSSSVPVTALLNPALESVSLRAELVGVDGSFVPFIIDAIDYQPTVQVAQRTYKKPGIAVHQLPPPAESSYHIYMVLTDDGTIGPPGTYWRPRCSRWRGGGWWSRFLYYWYGCH